MTSPLDDAIAKAISSGRGDFGFIPDGSSRENEAAIWASFGVTKPAKPQANLPGINPGSTQNQPPEPETSEAAFYKAVDEFERLSKGLTASRPKRKPSADATGAKSEKSPSHRPLRKSKPQAKKAHGEKRTIPKSELLQCLDILEGFAKDFSAGGGKAREALRRCYNAALKRLCRS